jgi:hypothetical protein
MHEGCSTYVTTAVAHTVGGIGRLKYDVDIFTCEGLPSLVETSMAGSRSLGLACDRHACPNHELPASLRDLGMLLHRQRDGPNHGEE